jgi:hypothetical protein
MKILTPVDQSRRDGIVLPYCVSIAKALDASIALVQVVPLTRSLIPGARARPRPTSPLRRMAFAKRD